MVTIDEKRKGRTESGKLDNKGAAIAPFDYTCGWSIISTFCLSTDTLMTIELSFISLRCFKTRFLKFKGLLLYWTLPNGLQPYKYKVLVFHDKICNLLLPSCQAQYYQRSLRPNKNIDALKFLLRQYIH